MRSVIDCLKRKSQKPIYWDRLALIIFANVMIAMGIVAIFDRPGVKGACFGFSVGIVAYIYYWRGGRVW